MKTTAKNGQRRTNVDDSAPIEECGEGVRPGIEAPVSDAQCLELAAALAETVFQMSRLARPSLLDVGVTWPQARTLGVIRTFGPQRITDLARHDGVAQPAMTALVARMERAGLVTREAESGDARAVRIHLTPLGRQNIDELREMRQRRVAAQLAKLGEAERSLIRRVLPVLKDVNGLLACR